MSWLGSPGPVLVLSHQPGRLRVKASVDLGHHLVCVQLCVQTAGYVEILGVTNDHHGPGIHAQQGVSEHG
jgi:hypothetical protein